MIAYGVLAGFFFLLWAAVGVYDFYAAKRTGEPDLHGEKVPEPNSDLSDSSRKGSDSTLTIRESAKV